MQRLFEFIAQQLQVKGASEKFVRLLEIKDLLALDKVPFQSTSALCLEYFQLLLSSSWRPNS